MVKQAGLDIRLIVSDLDRTLIAASGGIPARCVEAIAAAARQGIRFVPMTARSYPSASAVTRALGGTYMVCANGAEIREAGGGILFRQCFQPGVIGELMNKVERLGLTVLFDGDNALYSNRPIAQAREAFLDNVRRQYPEADDKLVNAKFDQNFKDMGFFHLENGGWDEVCGQLSKGRIFCLRPGEAESRLPALTGEKGVALTISNDFQIDVIPEGIGKGFGVRKLMELFGVEREQTLAFGDHINDISMFQEAGFSCCVSNGVAQARAAADFIVPSNDEGGVGIAIERLLAGAPLGEPKKE